jgi:hypothetical protein
MSRLSVPGSPRQGVPRSAGPGLDRERRSRTGRRADGSPASASAWRRRRARPRPLSSYTWMRAANATPLSSSRPIRQRCSAIRLRHAASVTSTITDARRRDDTAALCYGALSEATWRAADRSSLSSVASTTAYTCGSDLSTAGYAPVGVCATRRSYSFNTLHSKLLPSSTVRSRLRAGPGCVLRQAPPRSRFTVARSLAGDSYRGARAVKPRDARAITISSHRCETACRCQEVSEAWVCGPRSDKDVPWTHLACP